MTKICCFQSRHTTLRDETNAASNSGSSSALSQMASGEWRPASACPAIALIPLRLYLLRCLSAVACHVRNRITHRGRWLASPVFRRAGNALFVTCRLATRCSALRSVLPRLCTHAGRAGRGRLFIRAAACFSRQAPAYSPHPPMFLGH